MKLKNLFLSIAIALLLSAMIGCEEAEEKNWKKLPPATQKAKNTIGCLIDGKLWATNYWSKSFWPPSNPSISAEFYNKAIYNPNNIGYHKVYCSLYAEKKDYSCISINIASPNIEIGKKLKGDIIIGLNHKDFNVFISKNPYIYLTKFDTINKIISGRFSGIAINRENVIPELQSKDTVKIKITDGRFDMKLRIKESFK